MPVAANNLDAAKLRVGSKAAAGRVIWVSQSSNASEKTSDVMEADRREMICVAQLQFEKNC